MPSPGPGIEVRKRATGAPSLRGIEDMERMRLARVDIKNRVPAMAKEPSINTIA